MKIAGVLRYKLIKILLIVIEYVKKMLYLGYILK